MPDALAPARLITSVRLLSRVMCESKQLQNRIEDLRTEIAEVSPTRVGAAAVIAAKQSEIFVAASQLAEISTRRLARITWGLLILSAALLAVEIGRVFFP